VLRSLLPIVTILLLLASCQGDTVRRVDFAIQGIDVSRYQLAIDWEQVAQQDIHFAFVKATEGSTHLDTLFQENWSAIRNAGLRRGAYHFFRPTTDPLAQAQHFIDQVELLDGDLPPVLDIEVLDDSHPALLIVSLKIWLDTIYEYYGVRPILYTNLKFYNKHLAGHFDEYPLWVARYSEEEPVLACGREWQFWQYGSRGKIAGINGYVDFNVFAGDWQELDQISFGQHTVLSHSRSISLN